VKENNIYWVWNCAKGITYGISLHLIISYYSIGIIILKLEIKKLELTWVKQCGQGLAASMCWRRDEIQDAQLTSFFLGTEAG
jgi:hypothetical protein